MTDPEPEFRHHLRVRYAETDAGRVAHHGSYAAWLEEARTEWMRARGRSYREVEAAGVFLMIAEMQCRYLSPARYDDHLEIALWVTERRRVSLTLRYELRALPEGRLVAIATTKLASTDLKGKVCRLPDGV